jgi:hypothetical protein
MDVEAAIAANHRRHANQVIELFGTLGITGMVHLAVPTVSQQTTSVFLHGSIRYEFLFDRSGEHVCVGLLQWDDSPIRAELVPVVCGLADFERQRAEYDALPKVGEYRYRAMMAYLMSYGLSQIRMSLQGQSRDQAMSRMGAFVGRLGAAQKAERTQQ